MENVSAKKNHCGISVVVTKTLYMLLSKFSKKRLQSLQIAGN